MNVPPNAPIIGREEIRAAVGVLKTGALTSSAMEGGRHVREFEKASSAFVKSRFSVAVNSGTAALQAALLALGVGDGDEVLLPSFTFVATANAVASIGARPVFVDILKGSYTMSPQDLEGKITERSRVIIPVHLYGGVAEMDEILQIAEGNDLLVLEDAAQSLGSTLGGRHAGTFGNAGCYSLYPAKVITSGEGGFVVTDDRKIYERLLMIRNHGMVRGNDTRILGLNLRMPEIGAAIACVQMRRLPRFLSRRRKNAERLSGLLAGVGVKIPAEREGERANWYLYTIAAKNRDDIVKKLNSGGFGATVYYPVPVHKMPYHRTVADLPVTDWAAGHVLSVPVHPGVTVANIEDIAGIIRRAAE